MDTVFRQLRGGHEHRVLIVNTLSQCVYPLHFEHRAYIANCHVFFIDKHLKGPPTSTDPSTIRAITIRPGQESPGQSKQRPSWIRWFEHSLH